MVSVTCVDPKFHVHFQDRNEAFANGFAKMFNNENQCDVTFIVEGKPLKAHRHCMSFISKKLNESFEDLAQFEPIEAEWQNGTFDIVEKLLYYIYNGLVKLPQTELKAFVEAAQVMDIGTSLQDLNLEKILETTRDFCEIIYDSCGEEFVNGFQSLYEEEKFFDVTLQFDDKELKAHRHVLTACSQYFKDLLSPVPMHNPILIPMDESPVTYEVMENILRYIYYGVVTVDDLIPLLNAGEYLKISGLERADDLKSERPSKDNPNVFNVYSSLKKNTRTIQPIVVNLIRSKSLKEHKFAREGNSGSEYEPSNDSDDGHVVRRLNPMATRAKQVGPRTRNQKLVQQTTSSFAKTKQTKISAQMSTKARTAAQTTRSTRAARRAKPTNGRVKSNAIAKNAYDGSGNMDISLTQNEFDQVETLYVPADESHDQEDAAVNYSNGYESNDNIEVSANFKPKRHDRNNNQRMVASRLVNRSKGDAKFDCYDDADESPYGEFKEEPDYEYGSDDGAVGGSYGCNVYVEDLTEDLNVYTKLKQEEWSSNYEVHDESDVQMQEHVPKVVSKPKASARRGKGTGTVSLDDDEYSVEARFITTERGATVLAHNGHRYCKFRKQSNCTRWQCNQHGRHMHGGQFRCSTYALTKDIDGVIMAFLPPKDKHTHSPMYADSD